MLIRGERNVPLSQDTIVKALCMFIVVELVGLGITIVGFLLRSNMVILLLGVMTMIAGFALLSLAGTLKAAEKIAKAEQQKEQVERKEARQKEP
jgi:hypothetical protein